MKKETNRLCVTREQTPFALFAEEVCIHRCSTAAAYPMRLPRLAARGMPLSMEIADSFASGSREHILIRAFSLATRNKQLCQDRSSCEFYTPTVLVFCGPGVQHDPTLRNLDLTHL
jgi:hypothetical protein